ncbi:hypothetical protein GF325_13865 [Candidatus Bathyarchaeota archaeon]|nr:hypothetical protein [Candidatus Bathyarchaeota archaeon]
MISWINQFMKRQGLDLDDIDLVLTRFKREALQKTVQEELSKAFCVFLSNFCKERGILEEDRDQLLEIMRQIWHSR